MLNDQKEIKKKIQLTFFQDGLWDLVLGLFLIAWGLTVWFDLPLLPAAVFISSFWMVIFLKSYITYPRIGFAVPAKAKQYNLVSIAIGAVLLFSFLLIPRFIQFNLSQYFELIFQLAIAATVFLIGTLWSTNRWLIYAALVAFFAFANEVLGMSFPISFLIPGILVLYSGLTILFNFLRKNSVINEESIR